MDRVADPLFKAWVEDLNYISLNLSRKVKPDVKLNPDLYSLLYVPHGYVSVVAIHLYRVNYTKLYVYSIFIVY